MALPASVPDWLRPAGLPAHRMPSAQALRRLIAGNERYRRIRAGEAAAAGDAVRADFPFALVLGGQVVRGRIEGLGGAGYLVALEALERIL